MNSLFDGIPDSYPRTDIASAYSGCTVESLEITPSLRSAVLEQFTTDDLVLISDWILAEALAAKQDDSKDEAKQNASCSTLRKIGLSLKERVLEIEDHKPPNPHGWQIDELSSLGSDRNE